MQSPTASDPSFKAFLEKLQEQNTRGFATQLVQLKAEREIAGEDGDKREEQLDEVISSLKEVRNAVTGIKIDLDITPLVNIGENQTKLLDEIFKESSLTRKLTEGSVEYSKEMAGYRNTSGRDVTNEVSGKVSKSGQVIDFETARDALSAQGKRAKEANAFDLKPINYVPGKAAAAAVGGKKDTSPDTDDDLEKTKYQGFFNEIKSGFKFFMTNGLSEKPGYGAYQEPPKDVEKKEREAKVSSPRQENPEGDNVITTGEIEADAAKSDLELSKQMLDTTKEQLTVLKEIRDALAPKTPRELTEQKGAPSSTTEKEKDGGGSLLGDLASGASDLMGSKGNLGKMGGRLMTAGRAALPYAAAAGVALAGGAAVDYGLGKLGVGKDKEGNDLQVDTAQDDANWAKMSTGQKIQSGLARGIEKTGSALFLGNVSKEAQSERIKKETDYLNKNAPGAVTKEALVGSGELSNKADKARLAAKEQYQLGTKEEDAAKQKREAFEKDNPFDYREKPTATQSFLDLPGTGKFSDPEKQKEYNKLKDTEEEAFSKKSKARESYEKADNTQKYITTPSGQTLTNAGADLKKKDALLGRFGYKDTDLLNEDGQSYSKGKINKLYDTKVKEDLLSPLPGKEFSTTVTPVVDKKSVDTAASGKATAVTPMETVDGASRRGNSGFSSMTQTNPDGTPYTLDQINAVKAEQRAKSVTPEAPVTSTSTVTGAKRGDSGWNNIPAGATVVDEKGNRRQATLEEVNAVKDEQRGAMVAKTSTENADMERDAKGKSGANNTVVSNNVSSNNTTKFVPMKASPRPEYTGSSLDRYTNRITVY